MTNEQLEQWIDDLQSGMYINCVYCGHRYGPNSGPSTKKFNITMRKALEEHIASCPKHPLSKAQSELEQARDTATKAVQARIADAEKITRLESELKANAAMLSKQTDLARQAEIEREEARRFERDESRRRQEMHAALVRVASSLNYFDSMRIAKKALEEDR